MGKGADTRHTEWAWGSQDEDTADCHFTSTAPSLAFSAGVQPRARGTARETGCQQRELLGAKMTRVQKIVLTLSFTKCLACRPWHRAFGRLLRCVQIFTQWQNELHAFNFRAGSSVLCTGEGDA